MQHIDEVVKNIIKANQEGKLAVFIGAGVIVTPKVNTKNVRAKLSPFSGRSRQ